MKGFIWFILGLLVVVLIHVICLLWIDIDYHYAMGTLAGMIAAIFYRRIEHC